MTQIIQHRGATFVENEDGTFDDVTKEFAKPDLPRENPVGSEVQPDLPPLERRVGTEVEGLIERGGDQLAAADIVEVETIPLLGRDGLIGLLTSTLFYAFPKTGKTTLLLSLLREWLGLGYRILVFTEEPEIAWQLRLRGCEGWKQARFIFAMNADPARLLERARSGDEDLVVVDTIRTVLGIRDENDNAEVGRKVAPWLATCRQLAKTPIMFHHGNKAGGDHGRGISGAHSLFASFDAAYEIQRVVGAPNRRLIHGYARLFTPSDLIYEREEDGNLKALGDPSQIEHKEVARRAGNLLTAEWQTLKELLAAMDDPQPSGELLRRVLGDLVVEGSAERDPVKDRRGTTYRWRATSPPIGPTKGGNLGSETAS